MATASPLRACTAPLLSVALLCVVVLAGASSASPALHWFSHGRIQYSGGRERGVVSGRDTRLLRGPGVALPPQWYTQQRLNHFDPQDTRTWAQRYFVNDQYFSGSGPVFLMLGGEGPISDYFVVNGAMVEYAKRYGALCVTVEHRFYGKSQPTGDLSNESLKLLSSQQALADAAQFRQYIVQKFGLNDNNKWVVFGGSYPGSLSAWFRLKYPQLVVGSIASSAPVEAKTNFVEYYEVVAAALKELKNGQQCVDRIKQGFTTIESKLSSSAGRSELEKLFQSCDKLETSDDLSNFVTNVAGNFAGVDQYNRDYRPYSPTFNITIDTLCDVMNSVNDPVAALANINDLLMKATSQKCMPNSYRNMIAEMQNTTLGESTEAGARQWVYQTCTEFGYYQSSDSKNQPFGTMFPLSFSLQQCKDIYGSKFTGPDVDWTNTFYGAKNVQGTNIVFPNGSVDPWHALGVIADISPSVTAIFMHGTAHCANMYQPNPTDLETLKQARIKISDTIGKWLAQ